MQRRVLFTIVLLAAAAFAAAPVGPPTAQHKAGQFFVGFDYAQTELDVDVDFDGFQVSLDDVEAKTYLARIGAGLFDQLELYGLFGAQDLDGTFFAGGIGTKLTLVPGETVSWGIVYQTLWTRTEGSETVEGISGDAELKSFDIFTAFGPTIDMGSWRVYGGPGLYYYNADIDVDIDGIGEFEGEISETMFAAYAGAEIDLGENASVYGEYMFLEDGWSFGTGIGWKF